MLAATRHRRTALVLMVIAGGMLLAVFAAHRIGERRSLHDENAQVRRQLVLYAQALQQRIDRYRTLPQILALDPDLRCALSAPVDAAARRALNVKLERANAVTRSSTLTVIDRRGVALAASNWRTPSSNVGEDYGFRPYVSQAIARGRGQFYGIGMTTGEPGYYLSEAIRDDIGGVIGVIAIKIELAAVEREWLQTGDVVMVTDAHGVAFLASRDAWRYRTLAPLTSTERDELVANRQYARQPLRPLRTRLLRGLGDGDRLVRVDLPALPRPVLWATHPLPENGWQLHLLHDVRASAAAGRSAALAAGGGWLALSFLVLFVQQRRRLDALRQRSRNELEALLKQHAQELRTAQDGVVQAAQQAETGLSRSLAHLPQGVVIVDAGLQLVAWNARYAELFRFPAGLLRIGRPIEDLFRHNAQRGLLGPGPVEEAIRRRLDHLRSGQPHMRESEKEDGTVLEIRGNPLPDGGFVTSYHDITSYANAARELRSLADALEHRIAERTRALAEAKHDAENANRYKTRFVASAVHDLLQPLNAARMFVSALRGTLAGNDALGLADRVDDALAAQDAILNSLLDISRLEAGTLLTRVQDFRLEPLLDILGNEFGIVAASRGLRLEQIATSAVIRSDQALLRRILQNFLSNALRYTRRGRIILGCRRSGDRLLIEVHDQGPGIPESLQREIFEEFRRLDHGRDDDRGAGLGLAIVERIGRVLDHPIGLRSRLGHGSVFSVSVPLGDPQRAQASARSAVAAIATGPDDDAPLLGVSSWCIDDDPRVCDATRALLQRWGCAVPFAGGPHEALASAHAGTPPQLVLLDVRMGDVHGPTLYGQLCERWQHAPPVILVTAERDDALRRDAIARGWGFLSKPVRPSALRALMSQMLLRHGEVSDESSA